MPDEYISRAKALADFEACNAENTNWTPQRVKTLLLRQPAADVVPVVRCRACKEILKIIGDYDDNICYGYAGRSDCAMSRDFKAILQDCVDNKCDMVWM